MLRQSIIGQKKSRLQAKEAEKSCADVLFFGVAIAPNPHQNAIAPESWDDFEAIHRSLQTAS
ncbi:hypothetical protein H6G89_26805 [Oscillatoria sp. FACHB-1407]|uniref:hypothetical protein n=1 Tax=Oscillatoria sp. FACHB-1407 TaxID=2692847 RepID=UPI0016891C25|nr:hypothetical protein [Oscillatoria sp. FACHB-1407]MBD2464622.1 hypothetical protein [Oscillatoria sp. FACHB-1407]